MSGYEPGRPKIEEREAAYIWNGTRILLGYGVEWLVVGWHRVDDGIQFDLIRQAGERVIFDEVTMLGTDLIRCRVEEEDR